MIKANRTTSLLLPFYSNFGSEFVYCFEQVIGKGASNIRLYLGDADYNRSFLNMEKLLEDNIIFVQILEEPFNFDKYLLQMQSHHSYITDYEYENYKVIVFKLNEPFSTAIKELKQSNYSKMYDKGMIDYCFKATKDWYLMYVDDHQVVRFPLFTNNKMADLGYLKNKWDTINATEFYKKLVISPFHMLNKSENLRLLLEHIYGAEIPKENELVTKINLKEEILHYGY
jgi:hypothetical protein